LLFETQHRPIGLGDELEQMVVSADYLDCKWWSKFTQGS